MLVEDRVVVKNTVLNAILGNYYLCWRVEFLPYVLPLVSASDILDDKNPKLFRRLKRLYSAFWINNSLFVDGPHSQAHDAVVGGDVQELLADAEEIQILVDVSADYAETNAH